MGDDDLSEPAVAAALSTRWLGHPYYYAAALDSTNERLKTWLAERDSAGLPTGAVLLTDYQSAGRGRLDRRWEAPPGTSLLFSVLLRPGWPAEQAGWLTMLAGLAVAEAVEAATDRPARLKWPNDVLLGVAGEEGKVCGLLLDAALDGEGRLESAIVGIGLNVNIPRAALPQATTLATSLLVAAGQPVARRPLLVNLLARLERHYEAASAGRSPLAAWRERLITLGRTVQVSAAGATPALVGVAEDVDEGGRLLVRDDAGRLHTVAAGDVTLRGH